MGFITKLYEKVLDPFAATVAHPIIAVTKGVKAAEKKTFQQQNKWQAIGSVLTTGSVAAAALAATGAAAAAGGVRAALRAVGTKAVQYAATNPKKAATTALVGVGTAAALASNPDIPANTIGAAGAIGQGIGEVTAGTKTGREAARDVWDTLKAHPTATTGAVALAAGGAALVYDSYKDTLAGSGASVSPPLYAIPAGENNLIPEQPILSRETETTQTKKKTYHKKKKIVQQQAIRITNKNFINNNIYNKR